MNRRREGLPISRAIDGLVKYKVVEGVSERTLESCLDHLSRFLGYLGDIPTADFTAAAVGVSFTGCEPSTRLSGNAIVVEIVLKVVICRPPATDSVYWDILGQGGVGHARSSAYSVGC